MKEPSLVVFTLTNQMAAGICLGTAGLASVALARLGSQPADSLLDLGLVAALPLIGVGMLASLFHLGRPFRAYWAIFNFKSSWLSREILLGVSFVGVNLIWALIQFGRLGSTSLRIGLAWASALVGLGLVYGMSRVYQLRTVKPWNSWTTLASFYATMVLLGGLALIAALGVVPLFDRTVSTELWAALQHLSLPWIVVGVWIALFGQLFSVWVWKIYLNSLAAEQETLMGKPLVPNDMELKLRLGLLIGCAAICLFFTITAWSVFPGLLSIGLFWLALFLALGAEVCGRAIFYQSRTGGSE